MMYLGNQPVSVNNISVSKGTYFVAVTSNGSAYTADKTFAEIESAIEDGNDAIVVLDENTYLRYKDHYEESTYKYLHFRGEKGNHQCQVTISNSNSVTYSEWEVVEDVQVNGTSILSEGVANVDLSGKADKNNPVFTGNMSLGRADGSEVGNGSIALGVDNVASGVNSVAIGKESIATAECAVSIGWGSEAFGEYSFSEGGWNTSSGDGSHTEGECTQAFGLASHAENYFTKAVGIYSHAEGFITTASGNAMHVSGKHNVEGTIYPYWEPGKQYEIGDRVSRSESDPTGWECTKANSDTTFSYNNWKNIVINGDVAVAVGNGETNAPSNAYMLSWDGTGHYNGDVYVNCNADSTGGSKLMAEPSVAGTAGQVLTSDGQGGQTWGDPANDKAPAIYETTSGAIASFSDGADDMPLRDCVVHIEPVQDLHGQANPYPAGSGKNKWAWGNVTKPSGETETEVSVSLPAGQYTLSYKVTSPTLNSITIWTYWYGTPIGGMTTVTDSTTQSHFDNYYIDYTFNSTGEIYKFVFKGDASDELVLTELQIESGSTATVYAPYENICPITGWTGMTVNRTGVNVWDEEWEVGGIADGQNTSSTNQIRTKGYISVLPNTTYYVKTPNMLYVWGYEKDKSVLYGSATGRINNTYTTGNNEYYIRFRLDSSYGTTYNHDISINYPSTDTAYHAYSGTTYLISWQSSAGTVYGGTLDVTTGELVVDKTLVAPIWKGFLAGTYATADYFTLSSAANNVDASTKHGAISNMALESNAFWGNQRSVNDANVPVNTFAINNVGGQCILYDSDTTLTQETFRAKYADFKVVYPLATPQTYQLTPTEIRALLGSNNVWADTGDTAVEYPADTKAYVDGNEGVKDVQVNGTSILNQGVANIPPTDNGVYGVVKLGSGKGLKVNNDGQLYIDKASTSNIKNSSGIYTPLMPTDVNAVAFYGMSKAAGDITQESSSNTVGNYTEAAKSAISQMLNAPVSVSGTTPSITALAGVRYVCGEVSTLDITLPASGCIDVTFESGATATVLTITPPTGVTVKWANGFDPTSLDANTTYEINIMDGLGVAVSWT